MYYSTVVVSYQIKENCAVQVYHRDTHVILCLVLKLESSELGLPSKFLRMGPYCGLFGFYKNKKFLD